MVQGLIFYKLSETTNVLIFEEVSKPFYEIDNSQNVQ